MRNRQHLLLLVAILLPLVLLKAAFNPPVNMDVRSFDGHYYYGIAQHVANGDGLVTSVSRFHNGLKHLPHALTYYPLWPLLLGLAGRVIGLDRAAQLLPELLYFASLGMLYVVANRVAAALGREDAVVLRWPVAITGGHIAVLLLGLHQAFFRFTSVPFTEGLAYVLAFAALLATMRLGESPDRLPLALVTGIATGLSFLVRAQFIGLALAFPLAVALCGVGRQRWIQAAAIFGGAWAVIAAWGAYVWLHVEHPNLRMLVDNTALVDTPELGPYKLLVSTASLWDYALDRGRGLLVAFSPRSPYSYIRSFGIAAYLVPLALLLAIVRRWSWSAIQRLFTPATLPVVAAVLAGCASLGPVHLKHAARYADWSFQFRDGVPLIFLLIVTVPFLLTRETIVRLIALTCLSESLVQQILWIRGPLLEYLPPISDARRELAAWVRQQANPPVFLAMQAEQLATVTGGAYYSAYCDDSPSLIDVYVTRLRVQYALTFGADERDCSVFEDLRRSKPVIRTFGSVDRERIMLWRLY